MAAPRLVTVRDFNTSRFSQLADTSTANISDILARAEKAIESKLQRPIYPTQFTESYYPYESRIYLRKRPVITIDSLTRKYTSLSIPITVVDYSLDSELGLLQSPYFINAMVDVMYTAGFEDVPEDLKEAILMQAAMFAFQDLEIYGSGDAKEPGIRYINDDIASLLAPYKQIHTAYTR